jgi:hypothetical protein
MFFRLKKSGERAYVQIVENKRVDGAVRQSYQRLFGLTHGGFRISPISDSLAREDSRHACIGDIADGFFS